MLQRPYRRIQRLHLLQGNPCVITTECYCDESSRSHFMLRQRVGGETMTHIMKVPHLYAFELAKTRTLLAYWRLSSRMKIG